MRQTWLIRDSRTHMELGQVALHHGLEGPAINLTWFCGMPVTGAAVMAYGDGLFEFEYTARTERGICRYTVTLTYDPHERCWKGRHELAGGDCRSMCLAVTASQTD